MNRAHLLSLLAFFSLAGLSACSDGGAGCKFDVDCPGTQRCVDGACQYPDPVGPCQNVSCDPGEVCVDGVCLDEDTDADGDGWNVLGDCDDADPAIHPNATELCNERDDDCDGSTDEDLFCGDDCLPTDQPPASDPPATCDDSTACDLCYVYESTLYFCRRLGQAEPAWLAIPQMTPCGPDQHCSLMRCERDRLFHCDGSLGAYVAGGVPTADPEDCNGTDDDCDGLTDGPGAEASCQIRDNASAACAEGACEYTCAAGFHACAEACSDDSSPNSCGQRCTPCLPPDNADATCEAGACGFTCHPGHLEQANACLPCNTEAACGLSCTPCVAPTTCCDDDCFDLATDPTHCGACDQSCQAASDTCCPPDGCCPDTHPQCCDQVCCQASDQCCQGNPRYCCEAGGSCCTDHCCPAAYATCCGAGCCQSDATCCGDGCCPSGTQCCNGQYCCNPTSTCCPDGCCPAGSGVCCGDGCCPDGTSCCNSLYCCNPNTTCCPTGCCPQGFPVCCGDICCPPGTTCCNNQTQCCASKTGLPIPSAAHASPRPKPGRQPAPDSLKR